MAAGDGKIGGNIFNMIAGDAELSKRLLTLTARITKQAEDANVDNVLDEYGLSAAEMKTIMLTFLNGQADLPQQRVQVEYLKNDQKLMIPSAMGMLPFASERPEVPIEQHLANRYWRVVATPYAELKHLMVTDSTIAEIRAHIDAKPLPAVRTALHVWPTTYDDEGVNDEQPHDIELVFSRVSAALQFNCDLRDFGVLTLDGMRMSDSAWAKLGDLTVDRFSIKIHTFSLQTIAAMNVTRCGRCPLAGWTRAYGIAVGLLPARNSHLQKEYAYTTKRPTSDERAAVTDFETKTEEPIYPVAMNLFAMFGLFHLAKDHTFRSGDANMDRIGMSYLTTLRTMVHSTLMDDMKTHLEALVRTAQHPFGLGQTYAVALHLHKYEQLASPLRLRVSATPPPVQRLFIIIAARDEWGVMPIGNTMNSIFGAQLALIKAEVDTILADPPYYSGLYDLYGIQQMRVPSEAAYIAASALLPVVYGYAMVQHSDDKEKKEGLALALSLQNIATQHKTLAKQWQRLWEDYIEKADKDGLEKFLRTAYAATYE